MVRVFELSLVLTLVVVVLLVSVSEAGGWGDLVIYTRDQGKCEEVTKSRTLDCRWKAGLYPFVDQLVRKGRIIAYKIRWFNGSWSKWYVPGVNDIDLKFNTYSISCPLPLKKNSMRRMWSYFYDHTHKYIICKQ